LKSSTSLEYVLKKDRAIIISGLFLIALLSWWYIIYLYRQMYPMNMDALFFAMPMTASWTATDFFLLFLMWLVMMIAMMTPSVGPLILIFAMVNRQKKEQQNPFVPGIYLLAGYLASWTFFSLLATILQWALQQISWLNPMMIITNKILGSIILIAAGLFQFTSLKQNCLHYCQSPIEFIHRKWSDGRLGAFKMGMQNGIYCLGCCWLLMVLLFVSGVMNLLWIALICVFVLLEKLIPNSKMISYTAGVGLVVYGIITLAS
jgi:predicted metal-binding membrane protein